MTCPCFSLPHSLSLPPPPLWGVGRSVGFRLGGFFSGGCPVVLLLLSPRSVKGCGGSNGGGLSGTRRRRRASAGVVLERASQHRRAWGATVVQTWVCRCVCVCVGQSGRSGEGLAGAGRRAGRGPGCAVRGVPSEKGGRCEGADREVGKRGLTLSLSLSGLSLAPSSAGGAPCTSPRERSVRRLSSVRPSLILILFHTHPPLPPSGAAQTPRHLQRHQKGLCWGACRLYPGLRGCSSGSSRRRG